MRAQSTRTETVRKSGAESGSVKVSCPASAARPDVTNTARAPAGHRITHPTKTALRPRRPVRPRACVSRRRPPLIGQDGSPSRSHGRRSSREGAQRGCMLVLPLPAPRRRRRPSGPVCERRDPDPNLRWMSHGRTRFPPPGAPLVGQRAPFVGRA